MSDTIYIIRHGDKPIVEGREPYGVKDSGEADFRSLLVEGWQRAGCWVGYFLPFSGAPQAGIDRTNLHVFASAREDHDAAAGDGSKSRRPVETVTALAAMLRPSTAPDETYTKGQEAEVAAAAVAQTRPNALICWQHEDIPAIVNAVMKQKKIPHHVAWRDDCFNGVVVLTTTDRGSTWRFSQTAPVLLHGDTAALPFDL